MALAQIALLSPEELEARTPGIIASEREMMLTVFGENLSDKIIQLSSLNPLAANVLKDYWNIAYKTWHKETLGRKKEIVRVYRILGLRTAEEISHLFGDATASRFMPYDANRELLLRALWLWDAYGIGEATQNMVWDTLRLVA